LKLSTEKNLGEESHSFENNKLILRAEKWVNNGYCLGYLNEETFFISGAIPGELVECEIVSYTKKFKQVKVVQIVEPSKDRIPIDCDIFLVCGGCSFRHISYLKELELKKNLFLNEFNHKFPSSPLDKHSIHILKGSEFHYRNNVQFKIHHNQKGFFKIGTNDLVPLPERGCLNLPKELNESIKKYKPQSEKEGKLRFTTEVINYEKEESEFVFDKFKIRVPKNGFFQINRFLTEPWLEEIINFLPADNHDILELFSGSGLISHAISSKCTSLIGYEIESNAVQFATENAKRNHIANLEYKTRNLYQERITEKHLGRSIWIMNPPRNGLGNLILEQIEKHRPKHIIYSSCNYISLVQDLKKILPNYTLKKTTIADFFPRTSYFETLLLLEKR
jgi:tRNA/tmRNA/rRNA uracil-C5-methylase (TrmA/RlmC/RlmD family)